MSDWLDKLADSADGMEDTRRHYEEVALHHAQIIKAKGPDLWNQLASSIEQSVSRWNQRFPNREEKAVEFQRESDAKLIVRKTLFPQMRLDAALDLEAQAVRYSFTRMESPNARQEKS